MAVIDQTMAVPGVGMVEWGPADMSMSFGVPRDPNGNYPPMVVEARNRILETAKREGVVFAAVGTNASNVVDRIDREQIMFHFANPEAAQVGRRHTNRVMPY